MSGTELWQWEIGIAVAFGGTLLALLLILWVLLPFAVFGIKRRLDRLIWLIEQEQKWKRDAAGSGRNPVDSGGG